MNYIRDYNISTTPINWEYYKIFINLDKNKLPELVNYIQEHNKSERNTYFKSEFNSSFISFKNFLCWKN